MIINNDNNNTNETPLPQIPTKSPAYLTKEQGRLIQSRFTGFIPLSLDQEQAIADEQIKNQINVETQDYMGTLWYQDPKITITKGELVSPTENDRWNFHAWEKSKEWLGGITGLQPIQLDIQSMGLRGVDATGYNTWLPGTSLTKELDKERFRVDNNFITNRQKEANNAIQFRYGAYNKDGEPESQSTLIKNLLEQEYGEKWYDNFAIGTKNPQAFLEQVYYFLMNKANETTVKKELIADITGNAETTSEAMQRWVTQNVIADYDTVRDVSTQAAITLASLGTSAIAQVPTAATWALRIPGIAKTAQRYGMAAKRIEDILQRQQAFIRYSGGNIFNALRADLKLANTPMRRAFKALQIGTITKQPIKQGSSNPFNPIFQPRNWMQQNRLRIIDNEGVVLKEGLLQNRALQALNNIGLGLTNVFTLAEASSALGHVLQVAKIGAAWGGVEGLANSIWSQKWRAEQLLLQENRDIPSFNLSQTIADTALMAGFGAVLGVGLGAVTSPVRGLINPLSEILDGSPTLGTKNPRRGIFQLIGPNRVSQAKWELHSMLKRAAGGGDLTHIQIAKTASLEQIRILIKHLTGDDTTATHYLDPNWLQSNNISEHEVRALVGHVVDSLLQSSPDRTVQPVSSELFAEIFEGLAKAKAEAEASGNPLPSAMDTDIIAGVELKEKLRKYGAAEKEPTGPVELERTFLSAEEIATAEKELADKIKNKQITLEEAEARQKLLNNARRKLNVINDRTNRIKAAREQKKLLEEQYPNPEARSEEISSLLNNLNKTISTEETKLRKNYKEKTNPVVIEENTDGSIRRVVINGYDISNTRGGFLLTKYLDVLKKQKETSAINDSALRRQAREKLNKELDAIEAEMDASYKLNKEGKTRAELRKDWAEHKWNQLKNNPILLAQFEEAFTKGIEAHKLSPEERAISMNWYNELKNNTGAGRVFSKMATWGTGTTDAMYQLSDLVYSAFRMVDDGQFFAYSDLANPYQTLSIMEAIGVGYRKAMSINSAIARLKKQYPNAEKKIQQRVIRAIREGKDTINPNGLTEDMVKEGNSLLKETRDFYNYAAEQSKKLGKKYENAYTYFPQILSRKLSKEEVERLGVLGYEAMREKIKKEGILSWAELERLGLIERDENGSIINIPETSLFYLTDASGKALPLEEMLKRMPKTIDELRIFEAKRRQESAKAGALPPDLVEVLSSPIKLATLSDEEKAKVTEKLKSIIESSLKRSESDALGNNMDLWMAGRNLLLLTQRANEFGDTATLEWISALKKNLKEKRGIEFNETPENPTVEVLNSKESVKAEDNPTLKTVFVGSPEIKITKENKTTVVDPGSAFKKWVPEKESVEPVMPNMSFTSKLASELDKTNPFTKESQELGVQYTRHVLAKQLAAKFGLEEPTTFARGFNLEDIQDSLVTLEHLIDWTNHEDFINEVEVLYKTYKGKISKVDIGMVILGGYVRRAKEHNLSLLKALTPEQLYKVQREFHNINLLTLKARYEGSPIKAINPVDLLNKVFKDSGVRVEALKGKALWTPTWEHTTKFEPMSLRQEKASLELEYPDPTNRPKVVEEQLKQYDLDIQNLETFETQWKETQRIRREARRNETRITAIEKAIKKLEEQETFIEANKKELSGKSKSAKRKKETQLSILKARQEELAKVLSTPTKPVKFSKETKRKAALTLNKLTKEREKLLGEKLKTSVDTNAILDSLSDSELFNIHYYYYELTKNNETPEPLLDFLFKTLDEKATIAKSIGKLDELGLEANHFLKNGTVSSEGKRVYLKKLANSPEVIAIANKYKKANTSSRSSFKLSQTEKDLLSKEYWTERTKLMEELEAARSMHPLYIEELNGLMNQFKELDDTIISFEGLLTDIVDQEDAHALVNTYNETVRQRKNSLIRKKEQIDSSIAKYKTLLTEGKDTSTQPTQLETLIKNLEYYSDRLEKEINEGFKEFSIDPKLEGYTKEEVKALITDLQKERDLLWNRSNNTGKISDFINNDPITLAEQKLLVLEGNSKYNNIPKTFNPFETEQELLSEISSRLNTQYKKLRDLSVSIPEEKNEAIDLLEKELQYITTSINKLQKAGITANRNKFSKRMVYLFDKINEIEDNIRTLVEDPQFGLLDPVANNFYTIHEWMTQTFNFVEERTTTPLQVLQRLAEKPNENTLMNFNAQRESLAQFKKEKDIILRGMEIGLLFYRIDSTEAPSRFIFIDLTKAKLEPTDITVDIAEKLIKARETNNLRNPDSAINLDSIIAKREAIAYDDINLENLNKQINRLLKATRSYTKQRSTWVDFATNLDKLPTEWPELLLKEQELKVVKAWNMLPAQKELSRSKFNELFTVLKKLRDDGIAIRVQELEKEKTKLAKTFTDYVERSRKEEQVPVVSQKRNEIIRELNQRKQEVLQKIRAYGERLKEPTKEQQKEGFVLGSIERQKAVEEIERLAGLWLDIIEGKKVYLSKVTGNNLTSAREKIVRELAESRGLAAGEVKEILRTKKLKPEDLKRIQILSEMKGKKLFVGDPTLGRLNHKYTLTDALALLYSVDPADTPTKNALLRLIKEQAFYKAKARLKNMPSAPLGNLNDAVQEAFNDLFFLVSQFNQIQNNPDLLTGLKTIDAQIAELTTQKQTTANDLEIDSLNNQLSKLYEQRRALQIAEKWTEQNYIIFDKNGTKLKQVTEQPVYWKGLPGQNYPDTNMLLSVFITKVANQSVENVRVKNLGTSALRPIDETSLKQLTEKGSLADLEVRGRGINSDYIPPDAFAVQEESLTRVLDFVNNRDKFRESASPILRRVLLRNESNNPIYKEIVTTVLKLIDDDLIRLDRGLQPLYLTKGEKDRITQRVNVGIIKNQDELFEVVASTLRNRYWQYREGGKISSKVANPNKFAIKLEDGKIARVSIDKETVKNAFRVLQQEIKFIKDDSLAKLERTRKQLEATGLPTGSYYSVDPRSTAIDALLSFTIEKPEEGLSALNWKTFKDIQTGERIGGKFAISISDLRNRVLGGKLIGTKLYKTKVKQLTELGLLDEVVKDQEREYVSLGIYEDFYNAKLEQVAQNTSDSELFIRWGLTELAELKQKLNSRSPYTNVQSSQRETSLLVKEYTTLLDFIETYARDNNVELSEDMFDNLYKTALTDSGFTGVVRKTTNSENLISTAKASLDKTSPISDILMQFNNADMIHQFDVLSYIFDKQNPSEVLKLLPQQSLLNIVDELENLGLITLKVANKDELTKAIIQNKSLASLFNITYNGLEVLKQTSHASNRRGYFGGADIKLRAAREQLPYSTISFENLEVQQNSNFIEELSLLARRKLIVEKMIRLQNVAENSGLRELKRKLSSYNVETQQQGLLLLDVIKTREEDLNLELDEINTRLDELVDNIKTEESVIKELPKALTKKIKQEQTANAKEVERLSYRPWDGDTISIADKYMAGLNGDKKYYVGKWANSERTGLQDDMRAWAYGMNNEPYSKPTTYTRSLLEKQRPVNYEAQAKPQFTSEDLLLPENEELAGMLSSEIGDITLDYARGSLARTSTDLALRNWIKGKYGFDLPEGFGWGDWIDIVRNVLAKMEQTLPMGPDGVRLTSKDISFMKEQIDNLNHLVNQITHREIAPNQLPKDTKQLLRMSKNLTLGLLGPGFGTSVLMSELPLSVLRKNGSLKAFLKGLQELFSFKGLSERDLQNSALMFEKLDRGYAAKFGGENTRNNERTYVKRLVQYFKQMFKPSEEELRSSGIGRKIDWMDNFLANKAALSMEMGGMGELVNKVLSVAYEKEKVNLMQIKSRLQRWIKTLNTENFQNLARAASEGDKEAMSQVVRYFKDSCRQAGVPVEVGSYLWMAKLGNEEEISRLTHLMEIGFDGNSSFDLWRINKALVNEPINSAVDRVNKELLQDTLSKLGYYLELQARNASPEPFGVGSATFKYKKGTIGQILTFLASYPIAAYQTYSLRNGTTHTAAAMLSIALGVIAFEIFTKRVKDVISGKKKPEDIFEEYRTSPLAYFLRDLSYAQMGGNLDSALNPLYIQMGKAMHGNKPVNNPKDFTWYAPSTSNVPATMAIDGLIRQTYQAMGGLVKGDASQAVDGLGQLAAQGTLGKLPTEALGMIMNLVKETKPYLWRQAIQQYGPIDTKNEEQLHILLKDLLLNMDNEDKPVIKDPLDIGSYQGSLEQEPLIPDIVKPYKSKLTNKAYVTKDYISKVKKPDLLPPYTNTQQTNKVQRIPQNIINSFYNQRGVSPLLVEQLYRLNQQ